MDYTPTLFTKDGVTRTARTISEAVEYRFNGWTEVGSAPVDPPVRQSIKSVNDQVGADVTLGINDIPDLAAALENTAPVEDVRQLTRSVGEDWLAERNLALRKAIIGLKGAETTPFDILYGPSDSLGESAYVTAAKNRVTQLLLEKLRRVYNPAGVVGGYGYYGAASNVWVTGDPAYGSAGTVSIGNTYGLGRKHVVLAPGAIYTFRMLNATAFDVIFTTGPTGGTYEVKSLTAPGVNEVPTTGTTNAASLGHTKVTQSGLDRSVTRYVQITNTDATRSVYVEGLFQYDGDETKGIRMWEAAHAGYGIENYTSSTLWADSLPLIPNLGLVVLPIGSNDFYAGLPSAITKTRIQSTIALIRSKTGADPSIVLVGYYDRPAPAAIEPWENFTQIYREIAAADDRVTFLDMVPVFGPKVSDTDNRDGLMYPADHVHFTNAGAELFASALADFIIPDGANPGGSPGLIPPAVATAIAGATELPLVTLGAFGGGAVSFASLTTGKAYATTSITANATLAPSGMPPVTAGKEAHFTWYVTQDGTGSRSLTVDTAIIRNTLGTNISTAAGSTTRLDFYYNGTTWFMTTNVVAKASVGLGSADNTSDASKPVSTAQAAAIALASGQQGAVYKAAWPGGSMALGAFTAGAYTGYRLTIAGTSSFAASGKPTIGAGRGFEFFLEIVQDATGGRAFTLGSDIKKPAGFVHSPSTAANAIDLYRFVWTGDELCLTEFVKGLA